jgi:hypothetical protein
MKPKCPYCGSRKITMSKQFAATFNWQFVHGKETHYSNFKISDEEEIGKPEGVSFYCEDCGEFWENEEYTVQDYLTQKEPIRKRNETQTAEVS